MKWVSVSCESNTQEGEADALTIDTANGKADNDLAFATKQTMIVTCGKTL
jgi:hypothetical protein